jgi:hypothetical protein
MTTRFSSTPNRPLAAARSPSGTVSGVSAPDTGRYTVPTADVATASSKISGRGPSAAMTSASTAIRISPSTVDTSRVLVRSNRSARTPAYAENTMRGIQPAAVVAATHETEPVRW